eukprot:TRINITY_DN4160_c0_g1_i4.p1 TRINITY_DN4160_c0_g1~~TRINITY_DN4160_c0_g1_i4.p1  ORF type:complete len:813 (+),score=168.87 TRINITY_DN4160_c0_g1_i4:82-2520(+)
MATKKEEKIVLWFEEIGIEDVPLVGGKTASLGEMYKNLSAQGVNVPNGFAVTAAAYKLFIKEAGLAPKIKKELEGLNIDDTEDLLKRGMNVRRMIQEAKFPKIIKEEIAEAYKKLEDSCSQQYVDVAVRSSATAEDLPNASFAGQQETFLNVTGLRNLLRCCKRCVASLFTNRAISYRAHRNFDHSAVSLTICVQKMVRADTASSGITFTIDTETGFRKVVLITASWGLGENIVGGKVNPDEFLVFKDTSAIIRKKLGTKRWTLIYQSDELKPTKNEATPKSRREKFCLEDPEIKKLADWAVIIEKHYTEKNGGKFTPMDIEWAKDGRSGELFIVQARPETIESQRDVSQLITYHLSEKEQKKSTTLASGTSVGTSIACGKARVMKGLKDMQDFKEGEILVTEVTDPDWEPIIKRASAIVTNRGGRTCHAAIISREVGIPCVVGCGEATTCIQSGQEITVDCSSGEDGIVYAGTLDWTVEKEDLTDLINRLPELKTHICMNLANPDIAFRKSFIPNSGVGLARMEFIIANHIKCHPLALLEFDKDAKDTDETKLTEQERHTIKKLIRPYPSGRSYFVEKLSQGIATLSAAFYPKRVILRFSDFKTSEYASLLGGHSYEPKEENPMLGWRGASRYYHKGYERGFALECEAVKKVRGELGLTNLHVMIPFCRTVNEAKQVLEKMEEFGLKREKGGLEVMGMCEVPSNAILAEEFLEVLDGFSIGSNDLTQLILGVDRNSEIIAHLFDERNPAVQKTIKNVIDTANRLGKYIGICGQGPSDYPEFAKFLIDSGIQAISLNPDSILGVIKDNLKEK